MGGLSLQETTDTMEFRDQQEAYAILGDRDMLLQVMQKAFSCRMVSRGNALVVTGAAEDVAAVRLLVQELLFYRRQGANLTTHEVRYGAQLVRAGRVEELHALFADVLLVTAKGREVRAKTIGQRDYLAKIRRNAVTLGIGPAGTGKTYLAVVMAVAALRNREVSRIILTRPLSAPTLRCAAGHPWHGGLSEADEPPAHRGGAARLHPWAHARGCVHHPR